MDTPQLHLAAGKVPLSIQVGRATTVAQENGKQIETPVYTITLGTETIELLPFKNWTQLDVHKWVVQGKLPASPAGLEVTFDHVKIAGETVLSNDPDGCAKLEKAFGEWLALERGTLELAWKKMHSKLAPPSSATAKRRESQPLHYQVEVDHEHQVHIHCLQGKEIVATIGLNLPGFNSLADQGLLRKPRSLKVGALHEWVELDRVLYSFENGNNDAAPLERVLNERYLSNLALGRGKDVVVFANAASSTGFDIQFSALMGGVPDNRRRPLNEDSLELLQDPKRCGLFHQGLIVKLTRPTLVFKQKTPDGGERNLDKTPENCVVLRSDDGAEKLIDLSQPVNYLRLSAVELTAVFNHPSINKHGKITSSAGGGQNLLETTSTKHPDAEVAATLTLQKTADWNRAGLTVMATPESRLSTNTRLTQLSELATDSSSSSKPFPGIEGAELKIAGLPAAPPLQEADDLSVSGPPASKKDKERPLPNLWLKSVLAQPPIRFDWLSCLIYDELAEHVGNSHQGQLGPMSCWSAALSETEDIAEGDFKGIFLTEKHGLGFLNHGYMIRFYKGVAFIGTQESALEGIGINLVGVGIDAEERIVFIVAEEYRDKFDVPERVITEELPRLAENGVRMLTVAEVLNSLVPLEVVWTVPENQENPTDPQALVSAAPLGALETQAVSSKG
ncbi:MAG TPA: hypothetical protein VL361_21620 [Candidatus Limnocylindrales bacterium]|nr:hypothetical protein [Candidatus Limnocylindrales bacterium]